MRALRDWLRLPARDRRLTLHALLVTTLVRAALSLTSYHFIVRWMPSTGEACAPDVELRRIALAVKRSARLVPHASCLTQALVGQYLLAQRGYPTRIRIGVQRSKGQFEAHAWLMSGDGVVLGGGDRDLSRYSVMADLTPRAS